VTLILVNEQNQELKVTDPFGIDWIIPFYYIE
jgi:hypothetical protein